MSALVVDTSVWVDFFRGEKLPALEGALARGAVVLPPIVCSELLSAPLGVRRRASLRDMLASLPLHPTPFEHWAAVGELRSRLARRALSVSTPDTHVAQCALDCDGLLWSRDSVFRAMAKHSALRLLDV